MFFLSGLGTTAAVPAPTAPAPPSMSMRRADLMAASVQARVTLRELRDAVYRPDSSKADLAARGAAAAKARMTALAAAAQDTGPVYAALAVYVGALETPGAVRPEYRGPLFKMLLARLLQIAGFGGLRRVQLGPVVRGVAQPKVRYTKVPTFD